MLQHRGDHNHLAIAVQMCSLRFPERHWAKMRSRPQGILLAQTAVDELRRRLVILASLTVIERLEVSSIGVRGVGRGKGV